MKVKQVMHAGVEWVAPTTTLRELAQLMRRHDIGCIPVGENDRLVGMVTDRDIVCRGVAEGADVDKLTARDVMTAGIMFCREDQPLDDAVRIMEDKRVRRLPVINSDRRMVGMLSLGDVSNTGSRDLSGHVLQYVSAHHH